MKVFDNSNGGGVQNAANRHLRHEGQVVLPERRSSRTTGTAATARPPGTVGATVRHHVRLRDGARQRRAGRRAQRQLDGHVDEPEGLSSINGTYQCVDSDPATWSQNPASGGKGFCTVYGVLQAGSGGSGSGRGRRSGVVVNTKVGAPRSPVAAPRTRQDEQQGLDRGDPRTAGKPPLAVTFALAAPKVAAVARRLRRRLSTGTGLGQPPASLRTVPAKAGDFKPSPEGALRLGRARWCSARPRASPLKRRRSMEHGRPRPRSCPAARGHLPALDDGPEHDQRAIDSGDGCRRAAAQGDPPKVVDHTYKKPERTSPSSRSSRASTPSSTRSHKSRSAGACARPRRSRRPRPPASIRWR